MQPLDADSAQRCLREKNWRCERAPPGQLQCSCSYMRRPLQKEEEEEEDLL